MKKILTVTCLVVTVLCSCSKSFLEEKPLGAISTSQFYQSAKDITAALAGMYGLFQQTLMGPSDRMIFWGESRSDNYEKNGNGGGDFNELQLNSLTAANTYSDWTALYRLVGQANLLIKYIPQAAQLETNKALVTPAIVNNNMAQALAMRALCYFYITRNWGDAVIRTEPYDDVTLEAALPRSPAADVFSKVIIPDLLKAYDLSDKSAVNPVWYISTAAICAMLNDVYMWRKDYPNAILWFQNLQKAKTGVSSKATYGGTAITDLQPQASWNAMFVSPTTSVESIWNINWAFANNGCACMPGASSTTSSTVLLIDAGIFASWPLTNPTDIRVKATFDLTKTGRDRVQKYYAGSYGTAGVTGPYTVNALDIQTTTNVYPVMYRLGDQYLLYAEALNKTGDKTNSLKYLNFIRNRAGLTSYLATDAAVSTTDKLEDVILQERQWELFAEGKRWFDLVRTDHVLKIMDPIVRRRQIALGIPADQANGWGTDLRKYLWPLNRNVLNANDLLVQNPPYSD